MTILILNQHYQDVIGGSELQCDLIATHLAHRGHTVIYLAIDGRQTQYHSPYAVESGPLTWQTLRRIVQTYHPDLALWRFSKRKLLLSVLMLKLLGVKIVFSVCNIYDVIPWAHKVKVIPVTLWKKLHTLQALIIQVLSSRMNYFGYYGVDGVIAQTEEQLHKVPVRKQTLIYNLADLTSVPFTWERPFIIWVASLKSRKNPEAVLQLAQTFQHAGVDFLMVGHIAQAQYAMFNDPAQLPANVLYLGAKTLHEVNGIIQQALFLVHTTYGPEGFPNVFIQAWGQGKPVISLYCDPDQIIQTHQLGRVSGNFEQFVQDTQELIVNESLREAIGQRARQFVAQSFSPEVNIQQFERFFEETLAPSRKERRHV